MNVTDRNLLIGVTVIGAASFLYMRNRAKHNLPVKLFGLDADNSQKFVLATSILTGGILLINTFGKAKTA